MTGSGYTNWPSIVMLVLSGGLGVCLATYPRGPYRLLTLGRIRPSRFDLVIARLVGGLCLWVYASQLADLVKNAIALFALNAVWAVSGAVGAVLLVREVTGWVRGEGVEEPIWHPVEGETPQDATARYRAAWRRYRRLRIQAPLAIPLWFVLFLLLGRILAVLHWNEDIASFFALAWIPVISIWMNQWVLWGCPRCGYAFKGKKPFFPKRCYYCGLPKWAESPDA